MKSVPPYHKYMKIHLMTRGYMPENQEKMTYVSGN